MPELPEVENVRMGLEAALLGRTVERVSILRRDVVHGRATPAALLQNRAITRFDRRGKQLAMLADDGPCAIIHLGMTGRLMTYTGRSRPKLPDHTHLLWRFVPAAGDAAQWLAFIDPRRFGGVWTFDSPNDLQARWANLGDDALTQRPAKLRHALRRTRRAIKATLLDQSVIAGLGNIYVDELLFRCGLHPMSPACDLDAATVRALVRRMRPLLRRAIASGGSTIHDYADSAGRSGGFQDHHRVYGRDGQPCVRCRAVLQRSVVAGRSTVHCPACQVVRVVGSSS